MTERRYDETEAAAIFERAATAQTRVPQPLAAGDVSGGMTLAQLQEIGREVGIAPQLVADAALRVDDGVATVRRGLLGMPLRVERTIVLDRRLSDEEWEHVVVALRETFEARGTTRRDGSLRQWTNGNLQALLEPTASGSRIRLRTFKGNAPGMVGAGITFVGAAGVALTSAVATGATADTGLLAALSALGLAGVWMAAGTAMRLPAWARRRREQMDDVAARVAGALREPG